MIDRSTVRTAGAVVLVRPFRPGDPGHEHRRDGWLPRSVSSIWWRKQVAYVRPDQPSLYVSVDDGGREFIFETESGAYQLCETRDGAYRCRSSNDQRQWRGYAEPPPRR